MTTLQIIGLIYAISWFILFCVYIRSRFRKGDHGNVSSWYIYLIVAIAAPLFVLIILFWFIIIPFWVALRTKGRRKTDSLSQWVTRARRTQEETGKRKVEEQERTERIKTAERDYSFAADKSSSGDSHGFILVAKRLQEVVHDKEYALIQKVLDKASLPNGYFLCVEPCKCDISSHGDVSKLYITTPSGIDSRPVFDTIRFEDSRMGVWQAYLLHQITSYLPLWWHANYGRRDYIYTAEDILRIRARSERNPDLSHYSDKDLAPEIIPSGEHYFISCCYWSEFMGLIKEYVQLTLKDGRLTDFLVFEENTLYSYDCGIKY